MSISTHHIQSPSPTPAENTLGTAYIAAYDAGHTEGTTDAQTGLTVALGRIPFVFDHLDTDWAQGYWDAVLAAAIDSTAAAWHHLEKETR